MKVNKYIIIIIGVLGIFILPFCGDDMGTAEECQTLDCQNGGTFSSESCSCNCPDDFSGELCNEAEEVACPELVCLNEGVWNIDNCVCDCPEGYSGELCEIQEVEECKDLDPESVQYRLCAGETPKEILASDPELLDSLYGKLYKGGFIFEINMDEGYCKLAADSPTQAGMPWGCYGSFLGIPEDFGTEGQEYTQLIFDECGGIEFQLINGNPIMAPTTAAAVCIFQSQLDGQKWYLPSISEFEVLNENLFNKGLGKIIETNYWTASEYDDVMAWRWDFARGEAFPNNKYGKFIVQPIMIINE